MIIAGIVIALIGMGTYHFLIKDHFQNHETTQNSAGGPAFLKYLQYYL